MLATLKYYLYYFRNYIYLGYICIFTNRKKFKDFSVVVNDFRTNYDISERSRFLKEIDLYELIHPDKTSSKIVIDNWSYKQGNVSLYELYCICSIAGYFQPASIFEIGTFDGRTTLHMALNTGDKTRIHTLDMAPEELLNVALKLDTGDPQLVDKKGFSVGQCFLDQNASGKIIQHLSDSAKFDFSVFKNQIDMFFIDGAHSYDYVESDTKNALTSLRDNGMILWHDYGNILDVVDYLNALSKSMPVYRIKYTSIAVYSATIKTNRQEHA